MGFPRSDVGLGWDELVGNIQHPLPKPRPCPPAGPGAPSLTGALPLPSARGSAPEPRGSVSFSCRRINDLSRISDSRTLKALGFGSFFRNVIAAFPSPKDE